MHIMGMHVEYDFLFNEGNRKCALTAKFLKLQTLQTSRKTE